MTDLFFETKWCWVKMLLSVIVVVCECLTEYLFCRYHMGCYIRTNSNLLTAFFLKQNDNYCVSNYNLKVESKVRHSVAPLLEGVAQHGVQ